MSNELTMTAKLIKAVSVVPAKRLKLIELVNEVTGPDGVVDTEQLGRRQNEVNLALAEARAYAKATNDARFALAKLMANGSKVLRDNDYDEDADET